MCAISHCHNLKDRNYVDALVKWVTRVVNLTTGLFERHVCVKMKLTIVLQQLTEKPNVHEAQTASVLCASSNSEKQVWARMKRYY